MTMTTTDDTPRNQRWGDIGPERVEILCGMARMPNWLVRGKSVRWVERALVRELSLQSTWTRLPPVAVAAE